MNKTLHIHGRVVRLDKNIRPNYMTFVKHFNYNDTG